jgi:hypothetical protein
MKIKVPPFLFASCFTVNCYSLSFDIDDNDLIELGEILIDRIAPEHSGQLNAVADVIYNNDDVSLTDLFNFIDNFGSSGNDATYSDPVLEDDNDNNSSNNSAKNVFSNHVHSHIQSKRLTSCKPISNCYSHQFNAEQMRKMPDDYFNQYGSSLCKQHSAPVSCKRKVTSFVGDTMREYNKRGAKLHPTTKGYMDLAMTNENFNLCRKIKRSFPSRYIPVHEVSKHALPLLLNKPALHYIKLQYNDEDDKDFLNGQQKVSSDLYDCVRKHNNRFPQ